ncbi:transposon TX1 uncharacterized protein [Phanerochaete sordida]|uniref:Transposon TX1 uncharacterized protein n=1 Tax=Phanerochaete sordida TaxID=48140 RepID=A0A9P3GJD4_9APHY|nr:transposon TX1 uncharacterized protein [Phanerochaete sordida]
MRGQCAGGTNGPLGKWSHVNQLVRDKKIGILALQETHLTAAMAASIQEVFGRRLEVFYSSNPDRPNAQGVAIVLNKELVHTTNARSSELIPGRALLVDVPWHRGRTLSIAAVYAPNVPQDNAAFWSELEAIWQERNLPRPDLLLGDFNVVTDEIDRAPCRGDNAEAVSALLRMCRTLQVFDGWRETNPDTKKFSFSQASTGSRSRIDRIYCSAAMLETAVDWSIDLTGGVVTDHLMVSTRVRDPDAPFIGPGRWVLPTSLMEDKNFQQTLQTLGKQLEDRIISCQGNRSAVDNPQVHLKRFKDDARTAARERAKALFPRLERDIQRLTEDLDAITSREGFAEDRQACDNAAVLELRIQELERKRHWRARTNGKARYRLEGETVSKYWSKVNATKRPRDIIYNLGRPGHTNPVSGNQIYETQSKKMAETARDYYDGLQGDDYGTPPDERRRTIEEVLEHVDRILPDAPRDRLEAPLSYDDVQDALKSAATGKATGLDGIPYELWKHMMDRYERTKTKAKPAVDIILLLTVTFTDIETHGVDRTCGFAAGWLCPLYKKGDARLISNYRPITLLNTDYKLFTKALATKLAREAHIMIHENQAGFVPKRSIFDQVRLAKLMMDYAEATEQNGAIIALDQEKAYDKIDHEYLWETLRAFGLPDSFINTVKSLYSYAETVVMINGERSSTFRVTRGVRQGDPLSCLLFDLAIEPLACMLRQSALKGFEVPGLADRVLVSLFADDTTAFLAESDDFGLLTAILETWCIASKAKFNVEKTNIIPIGTPEYRAGVLTSRQLMPFDPDSALIPADIAISEDGVAVRILGAWLGNDLQDGPPKPWSSVILKVSAALDRWKKCRPTTKGKRLIVQMIVGGMTQYLAKVQGMPKPVEKEFISIIRGFMWDGARVPPVDLATLYAPVQEGGIRLLDIESRNEAIELTWLQSYLDLTTARPAWAYVADELLARSILAADEHVNALARVNVFLQTWDVNSKPSSSLPDDLRRMLRVAKKYGASFGAVRLSRSQKAALPVWYHIGADKHLRRVGNSRQSTCLREVHDVRTVGDLLRILQRTRETRYGHANTRECQCAFCTADREEGCSSPHLCCTTAQALLRDLDPKFHPYKRGHVDGLSLTRRRKEHNRRADRDTDLLFDPSLTETGELDRIFRVFVDKDALMREPAYRPPRGITIENEAVTAYTDGSCMNNGDLDASAGLGVWFSEGNPLNVSERVPGETQSNQVGEILAIRAAALQVPPFAPLHIVTDSQYAQSGLIHHLRRWEDRGWIGVKNAAAFKQTAAVLRQRTAPTYIKWVKGHAGDEGNEGADRAAGDGARLPPANPAPDTRVDPRYNLTGARLSTLTQATAYAGIRLRKAKPTRPAAEMHLEIVRAAVHGTITPRLPTDGSIWLSLRKREFRRNVSDFLWKIIHRAQKLGRYWTHIPGYEDRATCPICPGSPIESMEHILLECCAPGREEAWRMCRDLWLKKHGTWPEPSIGTILGCGLADWRTEEGRPLPGASRLYRILISETAHLIWCVRCERRVERQDTGAPHTWREVSRRWIAAINDRLNLDARMTDERRYGRKALDKPRVLATWAGTLSGEDNLPIDWTRQGRLLVSMGLPE